jgi:hypothetical protein
MTKVASYYTLQKRPRSVTIMMWGVFLLGLANGWRAIGLGQQGDLLLALASSLNPWVGAGLAVFWSIIFIVTAVALWRRQSWTRRIIPGLIVLHGVYYLALVMLFARSAASKNAWPAVGLLFGLAVLFSTWALYRPSVRWYFKTED